MKFGTLLHLDGKKGYLEEAQALLKQLLANWGNNKNSLDQGHIVTDQDIKLTKKAEKPEDNPKDDEDEKDEDKEKKEYFDWKSYNITAGWRYTIDKNKKTITITNEEDTKKTVSLSYNKNGIPKKSIIKAEQTNGFQTTTGHYISLDKTNKEIQVTPNTLPEFTPGTITYTPQKGFYLGKISDKEDSSTDITVSGLGQPPKTGRKTQNTEYTINNNGELYFKPQAPNTFARGQKNIFFTIKDTLGAQATNPKALSIDFSQQLGITPGEGISSSRGKNLETITQPNKFPNIKLDKSKYQQLSDKSFVSIVIYDQDAGQGNDQDIDSGKYFTHGFVTNIPVSAIKQKKGKITKQMIKKYSPTNTPEREPLSPRPGEKHTYNIEVHHHTAQLTNNPTDFFGLQSEQTTPLATIAGKYSTTEQQTSAGNSEQTESNTPSNLPESFTNPTEIAGGVKRYEIKEGATKLGEAFDLSDCKADICINKNEHFDNSIDQYGPPFSIDKRKNAHPGREVIAVVPGAQAKNGSESGTKAGPLRTSKDGGHVMTSNNILPSETSRSHGWMGIKADGTLEYGKINNHSEEKSFNYDPYEDFMYFPDYRGGGKMRGNDKKLLVSWNDGTTCLIDAEDGLTNADQIISKIERPGKNLTAVHWLDTGSFGDGFYYKNDNTQQNFGRIDNHYNNVIVFYK